MEKRLAQLFVVVLIISGIWILASVWTNLNTLRVRQEANWEHPGPRPDRVMLTWAESPATSFSVSWRTDLSVSAGLVEYRLASGAPITAESEREVAEAEREILQVGRVADQHVRANYHSTTISGLLSDTLYAYRVGDGTFWSEWFHVRTASDSPDPFTFIYFGDAQNDVYSQWSRVVRSAYQKAAHARFMVHAGDLVNAAHENLEWGEWFEAAGWINGTLPALPVPGNHEYGHYSEDASDRHLSIHWTPQFRLPQNGIEGLEETVYFIDYQGVRFVGLNSNRALEEQAVWLDRVLEENPHPWAILVFHHPVFSSSEGRDNPELRAAWLPVIQKHGVDLVMQGHDHSYARGRWVNASSGSQVVDQQSGTVFVNSVSGPKMYTLKEGWDEYEVQLDRDIQQTQLFQVVTVSGDSLVFDAYSATGELMDAFTLQKAEADQPNRFINRFQLNENE